MKKTQKNYTIIQNKPFIKHAVMNNIIYQMIRPHHSKIQGLEYSWQQFELCLTQEDRIFRQNKKLKETIEVLRLDERRYDNLLILKKLVDFFTYCEVPEKREAAQKILSILFTFDNIINKEYNQRTVPMTKLIRALTKPGIQEAAEKLRLNETIEELKQRNMAFETFYKENRIQEEDFVLLEKLKEAREKMDVAYDLLCNDLDTIYRLNEENDKDPVLRKQIGNFIDRINMFFV